MNDIRDALLARIDNRIPPENTHHLVHGSSWTHARHDDEPAAGGFQRQAAQGTIRSEDIVNADLTVIDRFAGEIIENFDSAFAKNLYATVGEAAQSVGNVVSARDVPVPEAFLEMLRRIEFGVDRMGQVTTPEIHLHPDTAAKVLPILENQGPAFHAAVAQIRAEKETAARAKEAERLSRFKTPARNQE